MFDSAIEPQKKAMQRIRAALYRGRMAALMLAADLAGFGAAALRSAVPLPLIVMLPAV